MLLIFSMRRVDVGRLLRLAWQDGILLRRHCLCKDWPYSRADTQVCDFWFELLILEDCVMWESGGRVLGGGRRGLRRWRRALMPCTGTAWSNAVDIFDATSGRWTTAALSVARSALATTSLPEQGLAIFAGGYSTGL
jgi:hypothetical protein